MERMFKKLDILSLYIINRIMRVAECFVLKLSTFYHYVNIRLTNSVHIHEDILVII